MTTQIRRTRIAAALAVGMLAGSMFGPAVADAARRVVADDVSCTTPCVQDAEIVGIHGSKVSGTVLDADTLDGLDAAAFIEQAYAGNHEIGFPDHPGGWLPRRVGDAHVDPLRDRPPPDPDAEPVPDGHRVGDGGRQPRGGHLQRPRHPGGGRQRHLPHHRAAVAAAPAEWVTSPMS